MYKQFKAWPFIMTQICLWYVPTHTIALAPVSKEYCLNNTNIFYANKSGDIWKLCMQHRGIFEWYLLCHSNAFASLLSWMDTCISKISKTVQYRISNEFHSCHSSNIKEGKIPHLKITMCTTGPINNKPSFAQKAARTSRLLCRISTSLYSPQTHEITAATVICVIL